MLPRRAKPKRHESHVQSKFISAVRPLLKPDHHIYAIPNGGFRLISEAVRLKAEGVKSGITDTVIIAPKGLVAWLETKTEQKGSRLSDEQIGFRAICARNGHLWGMYRNTEEGLAQMRAWGFLKGDRS